jgi:hypothetical protein
MSIVTSAEVLTVLQASGVTVSAAGLSLINFLIPAIESRVKKFIGWNVERATYTHYLPNSGPNRYFDGDPITGGYDMIGGQAVPRQRGNLVRQILILREIPVRSVTSIYENPGAYTVAGGTWPTTSLLPTNSYFLDTLDGDMSWTGHVYRQNGLWSTQARCVKVTYVAGLTAEEITASRSEIKLAVIRAVTSSYISDMMRSRSLLGYGLPTSRSIKDVSVGFDHATLLKLLGNPGSYDLPQDTKQMLEPYINYNSRM